MQSQKSSRPSSQSSQMKRGVTQDLLNISLEENRDKSLTIVMKAHSNEQKQQIIQKDKKCTKHQEQKEISSVCTDGKCEKNGAICSLCLVMDHSHHLDFTWNLENYISQIHKMVKELQPSQLEMNQFLIDFKITIRNKQKEIDQMFDKIDQSVKGMIEKAKESFEKDIDEIKTILTSLDLKKKNCDDFDKKIKRLVQYFGIDPLTRKVFRKNAYQELYKIQTADLLQEQMDYFNQQIEKVQSQIEEIVQKQSAFRIPEIEITEVPKFSADDIVCNQTIDMAHSNWIRNIGMFRLSEKEVINLNLWNFADRDVYTNEGVIAIVSVSDDMAIKIWIYSPEDKKFHLHSHIEQAHDKELICLRVEHCNDKLLERLISNAKCNNLVFTAQHGLIKIWDWVSGKCINQIKTQSVYTYDFEVLRFPELGVCFAVGSNNLIQVSDFTSLDGMLKIQEINPQEQSKDITGFQKIQQATSDLLVVSFSSGVLKIYNQKGESIKRILRQDKKIAYCLSKIRKLQKSQGNQVNDIIVVGSKEGIITAYNAGDGKLVWSNDTIKKQAVIFLTSLVVQDSYQLKSLVFAGFENSEYLYVIDGLNGTLIDSQRHMENSFRLTSICSIQGKLDPKRSKQSDSSILAVGTEEGQLLILKNRKQLMTTAL